MKSRLLLMAGVSALLWACGQEDVDNPSEAVSPEKEQVGAITFDEPEYLVDIDAGELLLTPKMEEGSVTEVGDWNFVEAYQYDAELFGVDGVDPWVKIDIAEQADNLGLGWLKAEKLADKSGTPQLKLTYEENYDMGRYIKLVIAKERENEIATGTVYIKQRSALTGSCPPEENYFLTGVPERISQEGGTYEIEVSYPDYMANLVNDPNAWTFDAREYQGLGSNAYINYDKELEWIDVRRDGNKLILTCKPNYTRVSRKAYVVVNQTKNLGEVALGQFNSILYYGKVEFTQE